MGSSRQTALAVLAVLALFDAGCVAVAGKLRASFVEPALDDPDAAVLSIVQVPGPTNLLSAFRDASSLEGALNLGGPMELIGERKVRLEPGIEFAFAVNLFEHLNGETSSCEQSVVFTPEPRAEYRAIVRGTTRRCNVEFVKVATVGETVEDARRGVAIVRRRPRRLEDSEPPLATEPRAAPLLSSSGRSPSP